MAEMIPESHGRIRIVNPADPGGGIDFIHNQDARIRWRIMSIKYVFAADGNVANREPGVEFFRGTELLLRLGVERVVPASQTWTVLHYNGGIIGGPIAGRVMVGGLPNRFMINDGTIVRSRVGNLQAGDLITDIYIMVEEWIEPLV